MTYRAVPVDWPEPEMQKTKESPELIVRSWIASCRATKCALLEVLPRCRRLLIRRSEKS